MNTNDVFAIKGMKYVAQTLTSTLKIFTSHVTIHVCVTERLSFGNTVMTIWLSHEYKIH